MKRIRKLLSLAFFFGIAIDASADTGTINYSLTMDMKEIELNEVDINGSKFSSVSIPGFDNTNDDNEPSLPVKFVSFQVPTYCNNIGARILSSSQIGEMTVDNPVVPGLNIPTRSDFTLTPDKYDITGQGYTLSSDGPEVKVCDEFFVNGNDHIVTLGIYPSAYNHKEGILKFYSDIQVELSYEPCGKSEMKFEPIEDGFKMIDVATLVENLNESDRLRMGSYQDGNKTVTLKNYVIIVPENLESYVGRLAKWKEEKGYSVKVQTVEGILRDSRFAIGANAKCFDKESSVREWMKYWRTQLNAPFFCLIVGDYRTSAPIRKFYAIPDYPTKPDPQNPNSEDYSPTDAYFSDLVTNWKLTKYQCGLYSCNIDTASFSPTIPIGRLLCSTGSEIERYTDKLLLYELFPGKGDTDYLAKGFAFQHYDAFKTDNRNMTIFDCMPQIHSNILRDNHALKISDLRPFGKDVILSMRNCGIMSWQGHGDPISISCAEVSDTTGNWPWHRMIMAQTQYSKFHTRYSADTKHGIDLLGNENYPAVAYSLACTIAPFDDVSGNINLEGNKYEYNMGSAFTVAGKYGGPALLANTRNGYWYYSQRMEKEFGEYLMENYCIGIAEMCSRSKESFKKIKFRHNLIGEPEFNVWTAKPMSFNGTLKISNKIFRLSGNNVSKGFYGVASKDKISQAEYNASNNSLSVSLSNALNNAQIATVYVWQNNYLPLIQIVTTGEEIVDDNREIFLTKAIFSADANNGNTYPIGEHPAYLNIGKNSNLSINALDCITSNGGINIRNQGNLSLNTNSIRLKNDKVDAGGTLNVKASNIILEAGVTIEAGSTAYFSTN